VRVYGLIGVCVSRVEGTKTTYGEA
jgi:hypothetical protein